MRQYFEKMDPLGKPLSPKQTESMQDNCKRVEEVMKQIDAEVERIKNVGVPLQNLHERGEMSVWERIDYLVDPGTFCPLHSIFDPENEESGSTGVVDGLARINGKWCVIIGFNNKWMAGAWIAGQPENNLRVTDIAKILNIPLVWLVNCSGVKLPEQEKMYANRRGQGTCFFRHAELEQMGRRMAADAEQAGERRTVLVAVRELSRLVELLAKMRGEISEAATVNVIVSPQWLQVRQAVLVALEPYPEARVAVAARLGQLELEGEP